MGYWVIIAFGLLFSLRAVRTRGDEKRAGLFLQGLWRDALDLFLSILLLVTLYDLGAAWGKFSGDFRDLDFLILGAAAYFVGSYQKRSELFSFSCAALAYAVGAAYQDWPAQCALALALVSGIFAFQMFFKGMKYAIQFTNVPGTMKGWPVLCLIAFCIAVVLSGIATLVF